MKCAVCVRTAFLKCGLNLAPVHPSAFSCPALLSGSEDGSQEALLGLPFSWLLAEEKVNTGLVKICSVLGVSELFLTETNRQSSHMLVHIPNACKWQVLDLEQKPVAIMQPKSLR